MSATARTRPPEPLPVFIGEGARARLTTPSVAEIFVTDTIEQRASDWPGLQGVSVAARLAEAIQRVRHVSPVGRRRELVRTGLPAAVQFVLPPDS